MTRIHSIPKSLEHDFVKNINILDNLINQNVEVLQNSGEYDQTYQPKSGKIFTLYYANWTIYGRNFSPSKLPVDYIPEIAYAFFDVKANGDVNSLDSYADYDKRFTNKEEGVEPLDNWNKEEEFYGCFGQFLKLKKQGKKFNLLLSLGGWSKSKYFSSAVLPENRINFIDNILKIFNKYPVFCGVSLDWEYVSNDGINYGEVGNESRPEDADNFRIFIQLLRTRLNGDKKENYKITVPCSANPVMAKKMKINELHPYVSAFDIMHYDFSDGSWGETVTAHHTNLKPADYCPFSMEESIEAYLKEGVPANKIMAGVAFYSRGFSNTEGPGEPASGGSLDKSWEKGIVDYKDLPLPGSEEYWDENCLGPFSYDSKRKVYNSYDNVNSVYEKCKYVWEKGLKGCIIWEASGDVEIDNPRSLIKSLNQYLVVQDPRTVKQPNLPKKFIKRSQETPNNTNQPSIELPNDENEDENSKNIEEDLQHGKDIDTSMWQSNINYKKGQSVFYKSKLYICIQSHTSNSGWNPESTVDVLWGIQNAPEDKNVSSPNPKPEEIKNDNPKYKNPELSDNVCKCTCKAKKIKGIKINGDIDFSNVKIIYEE